VAEPHRGLLVDFGGVLTSDLFESFSAFCLAEGIGADAVRNRFRSDPEARELLIALEEGRMDEHEFEPRFAALLEVREADGLIERLMAGAEPDLEMIDAVRAARAAGVRTGLVSNSWGTRRYDRDLLGDLFDRVVISGEVGMRKPAPEIYALGAERIGLAPGECVFVDDLPFNLPPAAELGMATVRHRAASGTIPVLEALLAVSLRR
jgi:putative hydrolase of the HAD superfamily